MKKSIQSIKSRLFVSLILPLSIGAVLLFILSYFVIQSAVNKYFDNTLYATAKSIENSIIIKNGKINVELPYFAIDLLTSNSEGSIFYSILDEKDNLLIGYKNLVNKKLFKDTDKQFYNSIYSNLNVRIVSFKKVLRNGNKKHSAIITVAETTEGRIKTINQIITILFIIITSVIFFTVIVSFFAIKNGLAPLYRLKKIVQKRDQRDLRPIKFDAPKELIDTVNSMNILLKRGRDTIKYIEQFNSDVSHQLRTPLAELKVLIDQSKETNLWNYNELNKLINTMSHITEQLLLYAKTNPSTIDKTHLKKISLNNFCKDYALKIASKAYARGFEFAFENLKEEIEIEADEIMLRSMLNNIINNALHYAVDKQGNPLGTIYLSLERYNNTIWLSIKDEGKGIKKENLESIFERFYRVDSKKSGSGLGLNIVKQIASLHNAKVQATNDNGLKISIIFKIDKKK